MSKGYRRDSYDTEISFELQDYSETFWDDCVVVIASRRTIALCISSLRYGDYLRTRWTTNGYPLTNPLDFRLAQEYINEARSSLIMACDIEQHLATIAQEMTLLRQAVEDLSGIVSVPQAFLDLINDMETQNNNVLEILGGETVPLTDYNGGG